MKGVVNIFGYVWATVNGINEYEDDGISDLADYDFAEWGWCGQDNPTLLITRSTETGTLIESRVFTDLRKGLQYLKELKVTGWKIG